MHEVCDLLNASTRRQKLYAAEKRRELKLEEYETRHGLVAESHILINDVHFTAGNDEQSLDRDVPDARTCTHGFMYARTCIRSKGARDDSLERSIAVTANLNGD